VAKLYRNSAFLIREAHILDRLYIMVLHISFYMFKKNQILAQNLKLLALSFTKNEILWQKLYQNSAFIGHEAHILDRLYIMFQYISFYEF
jgi:hypothetical protein